jgi:hypothetical protein
VGEAIYGELWSGNITQREVDLALRDAEAEWPRHAKKAASIARARCRNSIWVKQMDDVIHWLQHRCGLDMTDEGFDATKFEAFFKKTFPSATDRRKAAVLKRLKTGPRPGRGGMSWPRFCRLIEGDGGGHFTEKTIKRDVRQMLTLLAK